MEIKTGDLVRFYETVLVNFVNNFKLHLSKKNST